LAAAAAIYGKDFNIPLSLKAVTFFEDGDLPSLPPQCKSVSKWKRSLTSSFSRTAVALQARSKQAAPHGFTAIRREKRSGSKAE
jgi:hypothetical protein